VINTCEKYLTTFWDDRIRMSTMRVDYSHDEHADEHSDQDKSETTKMAWTESPI